MTELEHLDPVAVLEAELQADLDAAIDTVLDVLERAAAAGVELDPLSTIVGRMRARGAELDTSQLPPLMRMLLDGMGV